MKTTLTIITDYICSLRRLLRTCQRVIQADHRRRLLLDLLVLMGEKWMHWLEVVQNRCRYRNRNHSSHGRNWNCPWNHILQEWALSNGDHLCWVNVNLKYYMTMWKINNETRRENEMLVHVIN